MMLLLVQQQSSRGVNLKNISGCILLSRAKPLTLLWVLQQSSRVPTKSIELCLDLRSKIKEHVQVHTLVHSQTFPCNLPQVSFFIDLHPLEQHVFTLVLDLYETLVYSDWKVFFFC
ncbi:uncharacterized protein LOC131335971 isoform X2 [Rhododendron vialii]|uniref:uncharacterized protein LOC131335971 isoform X2 n=1 Tax=Rhododendron vialii TaxID=182163 RepID=UPI00265DFEEA|nr:uncharacterized protein LOC131335971 isoform X2 [Rhododendron vialii]